MPSGEDPDETAEMDAQIRPELIDDLVEMYVQWREECLALRMAYDRWSSVPAAERELAFAAHRAALDREEQASFAYATRVDRIGREAIGPRVPSPVG